MAPLRAMAETARQIYRARRRRLFLQSQVRSRDERRSDISQNIQGLPDEIRRRRPAPAGAVFFGPGTVPKNAMALRGCRRLAVSSYNRPSFRFGSTVQLVPTKGGRLP